MGAGHNDDSTTRLSIGYVMSESLTKPDLLAAAPTVYVRYSEMALFGMDDYANQTIRAVEHSTKSDIGALLLSCDIALPGCFSGIVEAYPELEPIIAKEEELRAAGSGSPVSHSTKAAALDDDNLSRNMIVHGAPGTGKSHFIENLKTLYFDDENVERVTFYPNYTYSQFVGGYKPIPNQDETGVTYAFVEGPFLKILTSAYRHPENRYLLIVEEINRANSAAVFGDTFQLLDRVDGVSRYPISISHEMASFLSNVQYNESKLAIPSNMFIWATMNSADQGVFPIDTAFRRRWDFTYLSIDNTQEAVDVTVSLISGHDVAWNALRRTLNNKLLSLGINEDKLIGPFFIGSAADMRKIQEDNRFNAVFKDKVITYLFNDVVRHCRPQFFSGSENATSFSQVCADFDLIGERVFGDYDLAI